VPRERIDDASEAEQRALFGPMDRHLRAVRERYGVRIVARGDALLLEGDDPGSLRDVVGRVRRVLERVRTGNEPTAEEVADLLLDGETERPAPERPAPAPTTARRRETGRAAALRGELRGPRVPRAAAVTPRTEMQDRYLRAIRSRDIVLSIGPAGTGKTYLAVAEAVAALRSETVRKIILTRPAVEAGERLGFLPGDFHAKIHPYLRPLYDALEDLLPFGEVQRFIDADVIEIVPLAYMRGRTLKNAFIILDEGQNTTPSQMKMFLTRMGEGSKVVLTGDVTQVDLPEGQLSGLLDAMRILEGTKGIEVVRFGNSDIQRHPLVQRIVDAYDREDRIRRGDLTDGDDD
jgi:phosphate starvation-inducible PhoH-like protein